MKKTISRFMLSLGLALVAGAAWSQAWPTKPIKVMIGFPPGTIVDGSIRQVANEMEKKLGQQMVFEFKPGASGTIAAKAAATAPADGYTLLYGPAVGVHPLFTKNNAVDSGKELVSVSNVISNPFYFIASGKLPIKTFEELRKYAAANPVPMSQGNSIETQDLIMEILRERTGIAINKDDFRFYLAYNMFRMAGILQGIMKRYQDGTAASEQALRNGQAARPMAEMGWEYASGKKAI